MHQNWSKKNLLFTFIEVKKIYVCSSGKVLNELKGFSKRFSNNESENKWIENKE